MSMLFFFLFLHSFPRSTSSEKQIHLCLFLGLPKCRPLEEMLLKDHHLLSLNHTPLGFPNDSVVKNPPANPGDLGSIPGLERSPGEGNGNPLQYSSLEILWTEEPGGLQSIGSQRAGQLSNQRTIITAAQDLGCCSQAALPRLAARRKSPRHFFVVVCCETGGGRVSCDYFPRSLNRSFWLFFLGSFSQILRGTPQRLTTAGLPQLALLHALGVLREFQKDSQRIIGSNWWEVWSVNWSLKSQTSTIFKTRRQGNVIDFSGIPWGLRGLFRKGSVKKGSCTLTKKTQHCKPVTRKESLSRGRIKDQKMWAGL